MICGAGVSGVYSSGHNRYFCLWYLVYILLYMYCTAKQERIIFFHIVHSEQLNRATEKYNEM